MPAVPADPEGFIPIDEHARVRGVEDVYAAGDGTNFPIKHGGIGTEEADAAAEHIAASLGAEVKPNPFRPVIRGKLLTGDDSLHMQHAAAGGAGRGHRLARLFVVAAAQGRRQVPVGVARALEAARESEPPPHSIDVEVALPKEWHQDPMALDPLGPLP